jgi:hypothetical protein
MDFQKVTYRLGGRKAWPCCIINDRYEQGNRLYLGLEDYRDGEQVADITVWLPLFGYRALNLDELLVKAWSENQGMPQWLIDTGIAQDTGERIPAGDFDAEAYIMRLTPAFLAWLAPKDEYIQAYLTYQKQTHAQADTGTNPR